MSVKTAKAVWRGTGKDGEGRMTTQSGVLDNSAYSYKTRFEDEKGTNPEELIAAAHAGCFSMALAFQLQAAGFTPTSLETDAAVTLDKDGAGFKVTKSALKLRGRDPRDRQGEVRRAGQGRQGRLPDLEAPERRGHARIDASLTRARRC